jgi:DNA-binding transcriptional MerR regulator
MTSRKLTSRALQQRYGVVDKTIDRWVATGVLPEPMRINGYRYWDEEEVEQRDRERERSRTACSTMGSIREFPAVRWLCRKSLERASTARSAR